MKQQLLLLAVLVVAVQSYLTCPDPSYVLVEKQTVLSYNCTGTPPYNGDIYYCDQNHCVGSTGYCSTLLREEQVCMSEHNSVTPVEMPNNITILSEPYWDSDEQPEPYSDNQNFKRSTPDSCDLTGNTMKVHLDGTPSSVSLRLLGWETMNVYETPDFEIPLPDQVLGSEGILYCTIVRNNSIVLVRSFPLKGSYVCRLAKCYFCKDAWMNLHCLPASTRVLIIASIVLVVIITISVTACVVSGFTWLGCVFCRARGAVAQAQSEAHNDVHIHTATPTLTDAFVQEVKSEVKKAVKGTKKAVKKAVKKMRKRPEATPSILPRSYVTNDDDVPSGADSFELDIVSDDEPLIDYKAGDMFENQADIPVGRSYTRAFSGGKMMYVLTLCCIVGLAMGQSCTLAFISQGTYENCVVSGSKRTCDLSFSAQISLPFKGSVACLNIVGDVDKPALSLNVSYDGLLQTISGSTQYYTTDWILTVDSRKRCNGAGGCPGNCALAGGCNPAGQLSGPESIYWPGYGSCVRSCGCSGCGCVICSDACTYSKWGVKPSGAIYKVQNPVLMTNQLRMVARWRPGDNSVAAQSYAMVGTTDTFAFGNFTLRAIGTFQTIGQIIPNFKMISTGSTMWVASASDVNAPIPGSIGDVQGSTANSFGVGCPGGFYVPTNLASWSPAGSGASYSWTTPGIQANLGRAVKLPTTVAGSYWEKNGENMNSLITSPGALVIALSSRTPIKVSMTTFLTCPEATLVSYYGCFSCLQGVQLTFSIKSTCSSGQVLLSSGGFSVQESAIDVNTAVTSVNLTIVTDKPVNKGYILFKGSGTTQNLTVEFTAFEYNNIGDHDQEGTDHSGGPPGKLDIGGVGGFLSGLKSWQRTLVIIAIVVASVIGAGLCLFFLIRIFRSLKSRKPGFQKVKEDTSNGNSE